MSLGSRAFSIGRRLAHFYSRGPVRPHGFLAAVLGLQLLAAAVQGGIATAADSPFGLPAPYDPQRPGSVMLHGGGPNGLDDEIRQEFVRLAGSKEARILLMPSDMCQRGKDENGRPVKGGETPAAYERRLASQAGYEYWAALKAAGQVADFHFLYRDPNDKDDSQFFSLLEGATGIWLPAYDQEWLPAQFAAEYPEKTSRFQLALREIVARGGVVGGLGGGMASLSETVIAGDAPAKSGWTRAHLRFGLALLRGVVVDQNFSSHAGRLERLTDLLRSGAKLDRLEGIPGVERRTIGLGVERDTVLILCGNSIRALGDNHGHIFLKSNGDRTITWQTLAAGEEPLMVQARAASSRPAPARRPEGPFNLLGLPEPVDAARPGTVVLHGGGYTDEIIDMLPALAAAPKPRLVHCPAARDSCRPAAAMNGRRLAEHLEQTFSDWRKLQTDQRIADLAFITSNDPQDANRPEFVRPLQNADALWFCGGDQRVLARLFVDRQSPTRFQQEVLSIVRRGGAVGGSSAGLAIMADVMIEGGEPANGHPAEAALSRGLGVLKHALAEQHFDTQSGRIERLTGLLRDHKRLANFAPTCQPRKLIGLAVEEDTALLVRADHLEVTGRNFAHVFLQAADPRMVVWHALHPGDSANLLPSAHGPVLELEDWEFGKEE